jgi:hypothetical protein
VIGRDVVRRHAGNRSRGGRRGRHGSVKEKARRLAGGARYRPPGPARHQRARRHGQDGQHGACAHRRPAAPPAVHSPPEDPGMIDGHPGDWIGLLAERRGQLGLKVLVG